MRILWRAALTPFAKQVLSNFLTVHTDWVDMDFILHNDFVTLHGCDETHVWFCVTDKDVDVYSPTTGPFVFVNQFLLAKKLVIVKWELLHKIAGKKFTWLR